MHSGQCELKARALMVQGTASYVGKTLLVTAFCKIFADLGYRVAPFKAQNMSLNSYVTEEGAEIARAQALQAFAAGIEPTADMNPILLKPKSEKKSQIMLRGKPYKDIGAEDYFRDFALREGIKVVHESLERLRSHYQIVIIEGAGSPAEPNLYDFEIANMRVAELAEAPVILVADIDRGGAFASIVGTLKLLREEHRKLVRGFIINKFRGELSLLHPALEALEKMTKKHVLGVLPYIEELELPGEDSLSLEDKRSQGARELDIVIIRLPHISNYTDFDPLSSARATVRFVKRLEELGKPDLIIIPGTKNTVQDLTWLNRRGFSVALKQLHSQGVPIIGICGGYQMLGKKIVDLKGIEGGIAQEVNGLGLLDIETTFDEYRKTTTRVTGKIVGKGPILAPIHGETVSGYEIHMGKTHMVSDSPLLRILEKGGEQPSKLDGAVSQDGLIFGCYIHGLFDEPPLRNSLLQYLLQHRASGAKLPQFRVQDIWRHQIEKLGEVVRNSIRMNLVFELLRLR